MDGLSIPTANNGNNYDLLTISLAGHIIAVRAKAGKLNRHFFKKYLVETDPSRIEHTVTIKKNLLNGRPYGNGHPTVFFLIHQDISDWLITKNVLTMHAVAIRYNGKAYLFSAPSGTGKSTHAQLWKTVFGNDVRIISGDQPLIRIDENGCFAFGSIWNGKERLGSNISAPIGGICLLSRNEENSIAPLSSADALALISPNVYIPNEPELSAKALELIRKLVLSVPFYSLRCNMTPDAAIFSKSSIVKDD